MVSGKRSPKTPQRSLPQRQREAALPRPHMKPAAAPAMDLNLLAAFDALWSERSVTRAGKRIGLSQPAMSGALSRLRVMLRDPLFVRDKSGLRPTERAEQLAEPIAKALAALRIAVLPSDFDPQTSARHFTIGCVDAAIAVVVPHILANVLRHAPHSRVFVRPINPSDAADLLESGAIDVAIAPLSAPHASLLTQKLFDIDGVLAMRKKHPLTRVEILSARDLLPYPHTMVSFEGRTAGQVDEALAKDGLQRHVGVVVSSFLAVPHVLRGTDAIAILPGPFARVVEREGNIALRPLPPGVRFPQLAMSLAWPRAHDTSPAMRWLRAQITSAADALQT